MKPWEQTWNDAVNAVDDTITSVKKALPWNSDWSTRTIPQEVKQQQPEAPKDDFWEKKKAEWLNSSESRQRLITDIKRQEHGNNLPQVIKALEDQLAKKGMEGTTRAIIKREYKDLTGKDYGVDGWTPWEAPKKPSEKKKVGMLEQAAEMYASASKPVNISEMAGEAAGGKVLEATGSPAAATAADVAAQLVSDPTNLLPQVKGGAAAAGIISFGGKKLTELLSDASFAHLLADITKNPNTVKETMALGKISPEQREKMLSEAVKNMEKKK